MLLLPIDIDDSKNNRSRDNPECLPVLGVYPGYYNKVGFNRPWIGYFASTDGNDIVGVAVYKGQPVNGKIEIAYGTFRNHEGRGIGTEICRQLILLAQQTDPTVKITARTFKDGFASMAVLRKNGFECLGIVYDEEDDDVLEWEWKANRR